MKNLTRQERIAYMRKNKDLEIQKKKSNIKNADGVAVDLFMPDGSTIKQIKEDDEDKDELEASLIINTTNILDSHGDVHLPGIWSKSLNENRRIMHLQEHKMEFDKIIADGDDLSASAKRISWKSLGFPWEGYTEALIFQSTIKRERNEYMFDQYKQGRVSNHSVGMQYVKLLLAIDDEDAGAEFEAWEKYIDKIVNKEAAKENGYFWVVKEAKVIEGSAVPLGSNYATPVQSIKTEPFMDTLNQLKSIVKPQDALGTFINHLKI